MLRLFTDMLGRSSIRTRIAAGFGILLALLVTVAISSDRNLRDVRLNVAEGRAAAASSDALSSFATTFQDAWHRADVYLSNPGASQLVAARAAQIKVDGELGQAKTDLSGVGPDIGRFKQAFETLATTIGDRQKALAVLASSGARLGNIGFTMASAAGATAAAGESDPAGPAAQRLNQSIQALLTASYRYALLGTGGDADIMGVEAERIRTDLPILRGSPAPSRPTALLDSASATIDRLLGAAEALRNSVDLTEAQVSDLARTGAAIGDRIGELRTSYLARRDVSAAEASATIEHVLLFGMAAAAVAVGLGILIAVLIGASISRLIARITEVMSALAAGDLSIAITNKDRRDEIGSMARALGVFKDGAIEKLRLGSEAAEARRLGEDERNLRENEKAAEARQDRMALDALANGLRRLASGDLVYQIDIPLGAKVEPLRLDFNQSVRTLQAAMLAIMADASEIGGATGEMAGSADDLSRRTEQQASSLAKTATALDEINATVRQTAQSASNARAVVATAKDDAERSGQVVRQTVEAMSGIERSSGQIGKIIGVIDEIAFQTNLLALNAGVEAARAGEAGRGFAVVASEVRALAQRSAEAAREIKALISASSHHVAQGVDLVGQTGTALGRILAEVAEINGIVADIAASAHEQAHGLDQVNTAINQMDQFTQQNASMVEASTQACHALSDKTESLSRRIGGFRLDGEVAIPRSEAKRRRPVAAVLRSAGTEPEESWRRRPGPGARSECRDLERLSTEVG